MIALFLAGWILTPTGSGLPGNRARIGEIEISGPLRDLTLSVGQAGESRIQGELLPGERVRILVPIAVRGTGEPGIEPRISWPTDESLDDPGGFSANRGMVRFLGWRADASGIEKLPPGILSRPRPPVGRKEVHLGWAALALLPACFVLALAARARRAIGFLVSLLGAIVVLSISWRRGGSEPDDVTVLELAAGSPLALEVRASFGGASIASADLGRTSLDIEPEDARVVWTGSLVSGSPWRARSPGSAHYRLRTYDPGSRIFGREENRSARLAETWVREDGEWTARGAWETGGSLPPPGTGPPPPGWLSAGLPQGISVLLGRLDPGREVREITWVRSTGF